MYVGMRDFGAEDAIFRNNKSILKIFFDKTLHSHLEKISF